MVIIFSAVAKLSLSSNMEEQKDIPSEVTNPEQESIVVPFKLLHADHLTPEQSGTLEAALKAFTTVRYACLPQGEVTNLRQLPIYPDVERDRVLSPSDGTVYQIEEVLTDVGIILGEKGDIEMRNKARERVTSFYEATSKLNSTEIGQLQSLDVDCQEAKSEKRRPYSDIRNDFNGYEHDLKGLFSPYHFQQLGTRDLSAEKRAEYKQKIEAGRERIEGELAIASDKLSGRIRKEKWTAAQFIDYLKASSLLKTTSLTVQTAELPEELATLSFNWSADSLNTLVENILRNAEDVHATQISISFSIFKSKAETRLEIAFHDNGPGYLPELLESGFQRGLTQGKKLGTGIGMAYQKAVLWNGYKARLTPSNSPSGGGITTVSFRV